MSYKVDWIETDIVATFNGVLVFSDLLEVNNTVYGDIRFDSMNFQLTDFRAVEKIDISDEEVSLIGVLDKSASIWNRKIKVAIVIPDDRFLDLSEVYRESLIDTKWRVGIFSNIDNAKKWCYSIEK